MAQKVREEDNSLMSYEKDYEKFLLKLSNNIKKLRLSHGYTQEEMTEHGFNYRHYQRLESGKHCPSLSTLYKVSRIYKINVRELF